MADKKAKKKGSKAEAAQTRHASAVMPRPEKRTFAGGRAEKKG